jgi:hypothetical protein
MTRFASTSLIIAAHLALAAIAVGCGGNNNNSTTTTTAVVAVFTPDTPTPADGSITLLQGTTSGAAVNVRVTVTQVPDFFGAAFRINYDPAALLFNGMDSSTSFLATGITDTSQLIFTANSQITPGQIVITATRVNPATPVQVTTTSDLVILNFVARLAIPLAATVGRVDFADPKDVCDGSVAPCGPIAVTWSGGGVSAQ